MWANLPRGMWAAGSAASSHILAVRLFARVAANGLKIGDVISLEDRVLQVRHAKHVKPGKGVAYVSCELSCLREGVKLNRRLRAAESDPRATQERRKSGQVAILGHLGAKLEKSLRI